MMRDIIGVPSSIEVMLERRGALDTKSRETRRARARVSTTSRVGNAIGNALAGRASCGPPSAAPPVSNRQAPVLSEGPRRDLYARRRLAALVLGAVHQPQHVVHGRLVVAQLDDLLRRTVLLDVEAQNRIEHLVGRQRILVALPRLELGGGRPGERALGNHPRLAVAILGE